MKTPRSWSMFGPRALAARGGSSYAETRMIALLILLTLQDAFAALDRLSGARVSLATTQQMLAAPSLPNLSSERNQYAVQASRLTARLSGGANGQSYAGRFDGYGVGLNYSPAIRRGLGYFVTGVYSQTDGTAQGEAGELAQMVHEFETKGVVANLGGSARLLGRNDGASIVGVFGGPAVLQFHSQLKVGDAIYRAMPFIYGVTLGAQWRFHLGNFVFNPYGLRFEAFTNACTKIEDRARALTGEHCASDVSQAALMPSFNAYGLVFGYRKLEANVYAKLINASALADVRVMNLSLTYTF